MTVTPAASSALEVMLLYNGFKAVRAHRRANWFYRHGMHFLARWISQRCVRRTNIEIHPAARLGRRVFIDHGTGVVIGETTVVGDDCTIYQGVTLGAPASTGASAIPPWATTSWWGRGQGAGAHHHRGTTCASPRGRWCCRISRITPPPWGVPGWCAAAPGR